jgi:hypothetical protein
MELRCWNLGFWYHRISPIRYMSIIYRWFQRIFRLKKRCMRPVFTSYHLGSFYWKTDAVQYKEFCLHKRTAGGVAVWHNLLNSGVHVRWCYNVYRNCSGLHQCRWTLFWYHVIRYTAIKTIKRVSTSFSASWIFGTFIYWASESLFIHQRSIYCIGYTDSNCRMTLSLSLSIYIYIPRVVTGEKNSPTVAHACRKRRLKWVLGAWVITGTPSLQGIQIWRPGPPGWGLSVGLTTPPRKKSTVRKPKMWPRNSQIN